MPEFQNQHFISRFYQKGFVQGKDSLIWVYEKGRPPQYRPISQTGKEDYLYAFNDAKGQLDTDTVEKEIQKLETKTAPIIKRLTEGKTPNQQERLILAKFVAVMLRRTPKAKAHLQKLASEMMPEFFNKNGKQVRERLNAYLEAHPDAQALVKARLDEVDRLEESYLKKVPSFLFPQNVLRSSVFELILFSMDWGFFRSSPEIEFVTSDNPVAFSKGTGLKDRYAVILFPLSKTLFLQAMWVSEYRNGFTQLSNFQTKLLNRYIIQNAKSQVYASTNSNHTAKQVDKWIDTF